MSGNVNAVFTRTAANYDEARRKLIPCYDAFYGAAIDLLPFSAEAAVRILDLGAGTGILSALIRERFPSAALTLVDLSEAMLARARRRLGEHVVEYIVADYSHLPLNGPYDAVVSALSIHHLPDKEKQRLFSRIHDALPAGGIFINAEQVAGPTPELTARYRQQWLTGARRAGASGQEIAEAEMRMREDQCAPVEDHLQWMRKAGFADADCWFKLAWFAVMAGTRERP